MLYSSDEAHKKLIECEEGNMMMHRNYMSKRQEVCTGLIDNTLRSFSHLRQHFELKGWIIKRASGLLAIMSKLKCTWIEERIYSIASFIYGEWDKQVQENELLLQGLEHTQENSKNYINLSKDWDFYLLGRILTAFLGSRMMMLLSLLQSNSLASGQSRSTDICFRLSALLCTPSSTWVCFLQWAWGLNLITAAHRGGYTNQGTELIPVLHPGNTSGLLRRESRSKFAQEFPLLIWDLSQSPRELAQYCSYKIVLNWVSGTIFCLPSNRC